MTIDPKLGVGIKKYNGGIYMLSDNAWESEFLVTDEGVIVFDAPSSYARAIPKAIASVTDKPVKMLIYSHCHKDHIGGSFVFKDVPGLQIVALDTVAAFLIDRHGPNRVVPNVTFTNEKWITLGGKHVQLTRHNYHSNEGDLFIYVPEAKFMMAIDCVTLGYAPFSGFDITQNFSEYMKVFDQLLPYDFDTFCGRSPDGRRGKQARCRDHEGIYDGCLRNGQTHPQRHGPNRCCN